MSRFGKTWARLQQRGEAEGPAKSSGDNAGSSYGRPSPEAVRLRGGARRKEHHRDDIQISCDGLTDYDGQGGELSRQGYESYGKDGKIFHRQTQRSG